jgi:hypothetical protein
LAVTRLAFGLRGETTVRPGRAPREIAELTRLEIVGLHDGSTVLAFDLAEHERPLGELDLGIQALGVFEAGLVAIVRGRNPPEPWDGGVAEAASRLIHVFDKGVDEIEVGAPGAAPNQRAVLTRGTRFVRQPVQAGERQHVEIEGRLLMADFGKARDAARIHRPLGPPVSCTFGPELESTVLRLLRRYVRAAGWSEHDDRGQIRMLELESLEDAEPTPGRTFWDLPTLDELAEEQGIEPVARIEDLAGGFWPEDESIDDFLAAIRSRD